MCYHVESRKHTTVRANAKMRVQRCRPKQCEMTVFRRFDLRHRRLSLNSRSVVFLLLMFVFFCAASSVSARPRVPASSRWAMSASVYMSDEGEQYSTGGTGTGVQTIVKERIKEKVEVRALASKSFRSHPESLRGNISRVVFVVSCVRLTSHVPTAVQHGIQIRYT